MRAAPEPFGVSDLTMSGAVRVLTHPRVFVPPTPTQVALDWIAALRASPNLVIVAPGPSHWALFVELVAQVGAGGNLVADAWHAALAIEHGCELVRDDADFGRFPALRWRRLQ